METRHVTTPRLFRPEAVRNYALARRGAEATRWRQPRVAVLWVVVGLLLAGLVGLGRVRVPVMASGPAFVAPGGSGSCPSAAGTVEIEVGSRPLYTLLPGLEWVPGEKP